MKETQEKSEKSEKPATPQEKLAALWLETERKIAVAPSKGGGLAPEDSRTSGLTAAQRRQWASCLLRLDEALSVGLCDMQMLDAFGEAAYRTKAPEALLPYAGNYKHSLVAVHMARAWMFMGERTKAREYLAYADESLLKTAIQSLLGVERNIHTAIDSMITRNFPVPGQASSSPMKSLHLPEFWQALAVIADAADRQDLVSLAEQRVKEQAYDSPVIHYNQAVRLLARGDFRAGWLLYEWRLVPGSQCPSPTVLENIPMWEGESLAGKTLLISMENGLGDQIFGLRFIASVAAEAARVEVAITRALLPLAQASFPGLKLHALEDLRSPGYWSKQQQPDYWCYSLSIPARAGVWEPGEHITTGTYLKAPEDLVSRYREKIQTTVGAQAGLPVYGIVWHGDIRTPSMRTRAYSVSEILAESQVLSKPCVLVNLQKDATEAELQELADKARAAGSILINAQPDLCDFGHTAAWISNLDRMYSCDTACAHAAGALGIPTTLLIRNRSIWCWLRRESEGQSGEYAEGQSGEHNDRSAWYDSVQVKYALTPKISYMFELAECDDSGQALLDGQH